MRQSKPAARILIVDDDATALALMRAALKKSGFDVSAASSGQAAFDLPFNWALIGHRVKYLMRSRDASLALRAANANNAAILRQFCGLCPICCLRWMVTGSIGGSS